jgi:hypothetical protein
MFFQQGDVIVEAAALPAKAKKIPVRALAEGEVTGHAHRVVGDAEMFELGDRLFLRILGGDCSVVHEEHKEQTIPPGDYEIRKVREYDHFAEEARQIRD